VKITHIQKVADINMSLKDMINRLLAQEAQYKQQATDIPRMEEWTPEDGEFGNAISAEDFVSRLIPPSLSIKETPSEKQWRMFDVWFNGNYGPESVNAGTMRRIYLGEFPSQDIRDLKDIDITTDVKYFTNHGRLV
jgi:hypothetical protein